MAFVYPAPLNRIELRYNDATQENRLIYDFAYQEAKVGLAAVTLQIRNPVGTAIGSTVAMSLTGSSQAYYVLDTTNTSNYTLSEGFIADMVASTSSSTITRREYFDVVRRPLRSVITEDIFEQVDPNLDLTLPSGETTYAKWINDAWYEIIARIRAMGNRPALILDSQALGIPHKFKTLANYCFMQAKRPDDLWYIKGQLYEAKFNDAFNELMSHVTYDNSHVGTDPLVKTNLRQRFFRL